MLPVSESCDAEVLVKAPVPVILPDRVTTNAPAPPKMSKVPPLAPSTTALSMFMPLVLLDRLPPLSVSVPAESILSLVTRNAPADTVMPPEKPPELPVLESVSCAVPVLVSVTAPPESRPENVVLPSICTVLLPESVKALSMVVAPVTKRVVPVARDTVLLPRLLSLATDKVPAEIVVVPA